MKSFWKHWGDGPAIAAMISAGIGCAVIGIATVLAEAVPAVKETLTWWKPAGPLTGKTGIGVVIWLIGWFFLHLTLRKRELPFAKAWGLTLFFIILGLIGTFPPVFELFASH